jgi:integrase
MVRRLARSRGAPALPIVRDRLRGQEERRQAPTYITPDDFAKLYDACSAAKRPVDVPNVSPVDWWRGLLMAAYMTGWRIGQLLALRWEDVDLDAGTAITRAEDNKGERDSIIKLHPIVVEHLRPLKSFNAEVFAWSHGQRNLYPDFEAIQSAAGVKPERKDVYGFHDLRRAFATMNANRMTGDALQALMQHKSYATTQRYIAMARQIDKAVESLYVPTVRRAEQG